MRWAGPLHQMAQAYSQRPSDLVEMRHALPIDRVRFDMAVMLWATTEAALIQWEAREQAKQAR